MLVYVLAVLFFVIFLYLLQVSMGSNMVLLSIGLGPEYGYELSFMFDYYSSGFGSVVALISSGVCVFSSFYMSGELFKNRFIGLIGMFVSSMFILLGSGNMFTLMIGWDGLGLISFLLVIYYESKSSLGAGMLTVLTNRIGDVLFMVVIGLMTGVCMVDFSSSSESGLGILFSLLILFGSITKSAQIPFSSWLPAAMAAPTPVSTLVHSSTLVTAGLFVLIRFSSGLSTGLMSSVLLVLGCFTCVMAGSCALMEPDMKKIVALSTLSQLGVMALSLSGGAAGLAFFHLVIHALFKALMFMCVGCVIMTGLGVQDSRYFSGLVYKMPITSCWLFVSCTSLSGFPFTAGFFSKDLLLEGLMSGGMSILGSSLIYLTCLLTGYYSTRLVVSMFGSDGGGSTFMINEKAAHTLSTSVLGVGSLIGGVAFQSVSLVGNELYVITLLEKSMIMFSVFLGFSAFLFLGPLSWGFYLLNVFVGKMFFLSLISGAPIASLFFGPSSNMAEMESAIDFNLGSINMSEVVSQRLGGFYMKSHWGLWGCFLSYLMTVILFFILLV